MKLVRTRIYEYTPPPPIKTPVTAPSSSLYLQGCPEDQAVRRHQLGQVDPKIDQTCVRKTMCVVEDFANCDSVFFLVKNFKTLTTGPCSPLAPSLPSLPGSP